MNVKKQQNNAIRLQGNGAPTLEPGGGLPKQTKGCRKENGKMTTQERHTEEERLKGAINAILDGLDIESLKGIHIFLYELYGTGVPK